MRAPLPLDRDEPIWHEEWNRQAPEPAVWAAEDECSVPQVGHLVIGFQPPATASPSCPAWVLEAEDFRPKEML